MSTIFGISEIVGAFLRCEFVEERTDPSPCGLDGPFAGFFEQGFKFGEDLFDGVQVWRIGRQEEQVCADRADGRSNGLALVAAQIIDDDNVAWFEGRDEKLLHIGREADGVDGAIEDRWRINPVMAKRSQEGQGFPVTVRCFGVEPRSPSAPSVGPCHIGLGPGLVDKDQAPGIDLSLIALPALAPPRHVRSVLLAGQHAFF